MKPPSEWAMQVAADYATKHEVTPTIGMAEIADAAYAKAREDAVRIINETRADGVELRDARGRIASMEPAS